MDYHDLDQGFAGGGISLGVFDVSPTAGQPRERALHDPSLGDDTEADGVIRFTDQSIRESIMPEVGVDCFPACCYERRLSVCGFGSRRRATASDRKSDQRFSTAGNHGEAFATDNL